MKCKVWQRNCLPAHFSPDVVTGVRVRRAKDSLPHQERLHPHAVWFRAKLLQLFGGGHLYCVVIRRIWSKHGLRIRGSVAASNETTTNIDGKYFLNGANCCQLRKKYLCGNPLKYKQTFRKELPSTVFWLCGGPSSCRRMWHPIVRGRLFSDEEARGRCGRWGTPRYDCDQWLQQPAVASFLNTNFS